MTIEEALEKVRDTGKHGTTVERIDDWYFVIALKWNKRRNYDDYIGGKSLEPIVNQWLEKKAEEAEDD